MTGRLLYWGSGSIPCWKTMLVLAEKGIDYTSKLISFNENETKGPEVTGLNRRGEVPTFKDGDIVIFESTAVCMYLESRYKDKGTQLIPSDNKEMAKVLQKTFEASENVFGKLNPLLWYIWETQDENIDKEVIKDMQIKIIEENNIWEKHLGETGSEYLAGDTFTMADVFFFPCIAWQWRMSTDFSRFPNIKDYFDRLKVRPSVIETWPPHWNEGEPRPKRMAFLKDV